MCAYKYREKEVSLLAFVLRTLSRERREIFWSLFSILFFLCFFLSFGLWFFSPLFSHKTTTPQRHNERKEKKNKKIHQNKIISSSLVP